jgi:hypothetical protein
MRRWVLFHSWSYGGQRKFPSQLYRGSEVLCLCLSRDQKFFCHRIVMGLKVPFLCSLWGVLCKRLSWDPKVFPLLVKGMVIICGWWPRNRNSLSCILVVVHSERLHEEVRHRVEQMEHHPERPSNVLIDFPIFNRGIFSFLFLFMYCIQHCFICRPSDSTVSEDAGIEPRTVAISALAVRRSNHYRLDLIHIRFPIIYSPLNITVRSLKYINFKIKLDNEHKREPDLYTFYSGLTQSPLPPPPPPTNVFQLLHW